MRHKRKIQQKQVMMFRFLLLCFGFLNRSITPRINSKDQIPIIRLRKETIASVSATFFNGYSHLMFFCILNVPIHIIESN